MITIYHERNEEGMWRFEIRQDGTTRAKCDYQYPNRRRMKKTIEDIIRSVRRNVAIPEDIQKILINHNDELQN